MALKGAPLVDSYPPAGLGGTKNIDGQRPEGGTPQKARHRGTQRREPVAVRHGL